MDCGIHRCEQGQFRKSSCLQGCMQNSNSLHQQLSGSVDHRLPAFRLCALPVVERCNDPRDDSKAHMSSWRAVPLLDLGEHQVLYGAFEISGPGVLSLGVGRSHTLLVHILRRTIAEALKTSSAGALALSRGDVSLVSLSGMALRAKRQCTKLTPSCGIVRISFSGSLSCAQNDHEGATRRLRRTQLLIPVAIQNVLDIPTHVLSALQDACACSRQDCQRAAKLSLHLRRYCRIMRRRWHAVRNSTKNFADVYLQQADSRCESSFHGPTAA